MVIGLALTLSLSTGGLWAVRRKTKTPGGGMTPLVLLVAFLGVALAGSAVVWANGAPPFRRPPPQPVAQPMPPIPGLLPALMKLENVRVDIPHLISFCETRSPGAIDSSLPQPLPIRD